MSGLSVTFLPGLLCTPHLFGHQLRNIAEGIMTVECDLPNKASMADIAADIWNKLEGQQILCGLSLGGIIAMEMFKQNPAGVNGLIFMDTDAFNENETVSAERWKLVESSRIKGPGRIAVDVLFKKQVHKSLTERQDLKKKVFSMAEAYGFEKFSNHAFALAGREDYSEVLKKVLCPVLIISGEADFICSEEKQQHLQAIMPHGKRVIISEAGHLCSIEQPEPVSEEINKWLIENYSKSLRSSPSI